MNLQKVQDVYVKKNDRIDIPSGMPSDINLYDFREAVDEKIPDMVVEGKVRVGEDHYLGIKVVVPKTLNLHSSREPLELIGTVKKGNDLIAYYRPASGWAQSTKE